MLAKLLSIGFNNCIQCGSFSFRPSMMCAHCEWNLIHVAQNKRTVFNDVQGVSCLGLFRWQRDNNRILNRLAVVLKGRFQKTAWDYYAERTLSEWLKVERLLETAILVPCPSRDGQKDHSYLFAEALARLTQLPLVSALAREDGKEQKGLSRMDRQTRSLKRFRLNKEAIEKIALVGPVTIYFIDDIITTGSTVAAAKFYLSRLGHVKAISLIIRE